MKPLLDSFSSYDAGDCVPGVLETLVDRVYPAFVSSPEKSERLALPGRGTPGDGCGQWIGKHCNGHDGGYWGRCHCNERGCPNCSQRWASREAHEASKKVAWRVKYWQDRRASILERRIGAGSPLDPMWLSKKALVGHFVVSMRSDLGPLWKKNRWNEDKARQLAYAICRRHRVAGGIAIFHPWRRDEDFEYVPDGYWHFHIIGVHFMPTSPGGSDFAPDGSPVVFKHIKDDEYRNFGGLRSQRAISRVIQYQLTHAGLRKGRQALTYFGLLHHSSVPKAKVQEPYPQCLDEDSKTDPRIPPTCPACGSKDLEDCIQNEPEYETLPSLNYRRFVGIGTRTVHAEPHHKPTPERFDEEKAKLETEFQDRYDEERDSSKRHQLTKDRQHERVVLAGRELELCNLNDPLVRCWVWLRTLLEERGEPIPRSELSSDATPGLAEYRKWCAETGFRCNVPLDNLEVLERCIKLNIKHGRLHMTPDGEYLTLIHVYGLDDALRDMRQIIQFKSRGTDKSIGLAAPETLGHDRRLEMLIAHGPREDLMTDEGYLFGSLVEKCRGQCVGASR